MLYMSAVDRLAVGGKISTLLRLVHIEYVCVWVYAITPSFFHCQAFFQLASQLAILACCWAVMPPTYKYRLVMLCWVLIFFVFVQICFVTDCGGILGYYGRSSPQASDLSEDFDKVE